MEKKDTQYSKQQIVPSDAEHVFLTFDSPKNSAKTKKPNYESPNPLLLSNERVVPPFKNLRSLLATAMILSYYGDSWEVTLLMERLSKTSADYIQKNELKGFVKKCSIKERHIAIKLNIFHRSNLGSKFRYPDDKTLKKMQRFELANKRRLKLERICRNDGLASIQFVFSDNFRSPIFGGRSTELAERLCLSNEQITRISVGFGREYSIYLKEPGHLRFKHTPDLEQFNQEIDYTIPDGLDIIGLEGKTDCLGISSLSLLLWSTSDQNSEDHFTQLENAFRLAQRPFSRCQRSIVDIIFVSLCCLAFVCPFFLISNFGTIDLIVQGDYAAAAFMAFVALSTNVFCCIFSFVFCKNLRTFCMYPSVKPPVQVKKQK